jgi:PAS domain S-box-containing protein
MTSLKPTDLTAVIIQYSLTIGPDAPVTSAIALMSGAPHFCALTCDIAHGDDLLIEDCSSCVVVVEPDRRVVGILTERDVVRLSAQQRPLDQLSVAEVMTPSVITRRQSDLTDLIRTIDLLKQEHIRHLPIVDEQDRLVGLVTHESLRQLARPGDLLRLRLVQEVMVTQVLTAGPDSSMLTIARLMADRKVSSVVIVGPSGSADAPCQQAVGLLTERDLVQFQAMGLSLAETTAQAMMSSPVFTVAPEVTLWTVQQVMEQRRIRRVVVTGAQGELLGIVTQTNLLQAFNPLELCQLAEVLEQKVMQLETERIALLQSQAAELELHITESHQAMRMQAEHDRLLQSFAMATNHLLTLQDGQESVQVALEALGTALRVDRSYIFENHPHLTTRERVLSQRWEWVAEGVTPQIDNPDLQNVPFLEIAPSSYSTLSQGQTLAGLVKDFPEEEQAILLPQGIVSILLTPIFIEDYFWGIVGFDDCRKERVWDISTQLALKAIASTIGTAIARGRAEANATLLANRLQEAQRIAKLGGWEIDFQANSHYWSEEMFRIFEIDGQPFAPSYEAFLDRVHPDDRTLVDVAYTNHLRDRQANYCLVHRLQMPDGRIKYVQGQGETLFSVDGAPLISKGTVQDITQQHNAEIRRDRAEAALRQIIEGTAAFTGEEFFPALVRHIAEALGVRYAGVSQSTPEGFQTLAFVANGELCPMPFLPYESVPCSTEALTTGQCYQPANLQSLYPDNDLIGALQVDSYLGVGLRNSAGEPIGNLCIFHDAPLADADWAETLLTIFAARAGAELERLMTAQDLEQLNGELEARVAERTAALADREAFLQDFLDNANDLIQMVDIDTGRFEFVNRAWRDVLGYTAAEVEQLTIFDVLAPDCIPHCQAVIDQMRAGTLTQVEQVELTFVHRSGQLVLVEGSINCRLGGSADGRPRTLSTRAIFRDITAKKAAEQEIQRREARYRALMEEASDAILLTNTEGYLIEANPKAAELLGYDRHELVGMHFTQIHPPEILPTVVKAFEALTNREQLGTLSLEFLQRDGQRVPGDATASVIDVGGETIVQAIVHDIRDRQQAEQALRESEARFRRVFESNVVGMMFTDFSGQVTAANDRFLAMLGYTRQELELGGGLNWAELTPPEYQALDQTAIAQLQHHGSISPWEKAYYHKDGHLVSVLIGVAMLSQAEGTCVCVVVDISDRKHYETALKDSQQLLQTVLDTVPLSVFWKDRHSVILGCNQAFATAAGFAEPADMVGKNNFDLGLTQAEAESYTADSRQVVTSGIAKLGIEETITPAGGEPRWVETNKLPLRDGDGNIIGVVGTSQDITVRKQAEQTIRQQAERETVLREITQRIRESLELKTIFDTACEEIRTYLQADRVGIFKFHPDSGHNDGEFVAESVVPGWPTVVAIGVHDHCFGENYAALYAKGRYYVADDIYNTGSQSCHPDMLAQFQVRANLVMPLLCNNELWGLLCIHQCDAPRHWHQSEIDLGQQLANQLAIAIQQAILYEQLQSELQERQRAEAQLTQRNEDLTRATRLKDEFLANMSHELRTPLNAILGMTEALQEEDVFGPVNAQQLKALKTVERSGSHLLELINDVLDLAKVEAGLMELDVAPTAIAPLCHASLAFVKQPALKKHIQLTVNLPADLPTISLDERRIRQVLINLLNNAVKFTPEGGQITLDVTPVAPSMSEATSAYLRFAVTDTGIGIAPAEQQRLFQPFVQVDSALNRRYQGTGLGLALVKRIVDLHGGQVGLTSAVGVGSCFTVDLPYTRSIAPLTPTPTPYSSPDVPSPAVAIAPLILLTEDNEANIITMVSYLEAKGYRVEIAHNGQEALDRLQHLTPDLILMDIQMPGMDGLEAIGHIRRNPSLAEVPVIALTSLAMSGDRDHCLAAGATEYLSKPVRLKQLAEMIQTLISSGYPSPIPDP